MEREPEIDFNWFKLMVVAVEELVKVRSPLISSTEFNSMGPAPSPWTVIVPAKVGQAFNRETPAAAVMVVENEQESEDDRAASTRPAVKAAVPANKVDLENFMVMLRI